MLIPNNKYVYAPFYRWFFKSSKYINAIQSTSNLVRDGQAMRYANFVKVPLFIIPIEEQQQIAEYLTAKISEVDEILSVKQQQLTTLADYKKSLIYEYVTGKKEVPVS
jgi:type I restriction enzyme S subunit